MLYNLSGNLLEIYGKKSEEIKMTQKEIEDEVFFNKDTQKWHLKSSNKLCNGKIIKHYKNGQIEYERNYKDGLEHGKQLWFYENGEIMTEENYKNGKRDGIQIDFERDGSIKWRGNYKNGKRVG